MPLILAIEADRRQTSKIAALAKGPLRAELVAGDTTEHAVAALAGRVPDLILTSLLLSPRDEAALADWLRELDAAGRHVPTLVIPVLGVPGGSQQDSGLLKRFRGRNRAATPDGCDPAMFAAQIFEYLERSAEERRAAATFAAPNPSRPVVEQFPIAESPQPAYEAPPFTPVYEPTPVPAYEETLTPAYEIDPMPAYETTPAPTYEPAPAYETEPTPAYGAPSADILGLRSLETAPAYEPEPEPTPEPEPVTFEAAVEAEAEESWEDVTIEEEGEEDAEEELELKAEAIDLDTFVSELRALGGRAGQERRDRQDVQDGRERQEGYRPGPPALPARPALPALPALPADVDPGVAEFIAALNAMQTLERVKPTSEVVAETPDPIAAAPPPASERGRRKKRAKVTPPAQDEWGMFDPQQCGFAALMAKLDAMNDEDHRDEKKKARSR